MIALKIFGAVAGWILCGVLAYNLLMLLCAGIEMTDKEKAIRLLLCILFAPMLLFLCVVEVVVLSLFKICLFFVVHKEKKEEVND